MFNRDIVLPAPGKETFFLWGPRQTGKSTLLRTRYPRSRWLDLLRADEFRRYTANPEFLRQEIEAQRRPAPEDQIVIDEIQKVPALLDEVHWLIENRGLHFALCGSSVRKVRRGAANLLGGRALRYELHGLTANELGNEFDLSRMLNHGYLPRMYEADRPARRLDAYVADYLKEEVAAEGLVRNLPAFSGFRDAAALCDGEMINFSNIAGGCAAWRTSIPKSASGSWCAWSRGRGTRTTASTSFPHRSSSAASGKRTSWRDRRRLSSPMPPASGRKVRQRVRMRIEEAGLTRFGGSDEAPPGCPRGIALGQLR